MIRSLQLPTRFYLSAYRTAELFLMRTGLWDSGLRRGAARLDRLARRVWLGPSVPESAMVDGHRVFFPPQFHKAYLEMVGLRYLPGPARLLRTLLRPGMTLVDLGANIGYMTLIAARAVAPGGHVYAFEPEPYALSLLDKNIKANHYEDVVTVIPKAVTDSTGTLTLYRHTDADLATSLYADYFPDTITDITTIDTITLDEYFSSLQWPRVDVIKLNIEGAEHAALRGMIRLSQNNPSMMLILEFNPAAIAAAHVAPADLFNTLSTLGFSLCYVINSNGSKLQPINISADLSRLVQRAYRSEAQCVFLLCAKPSVAYAACL